MTALTPGVPFETPDSRLAVDGGLVPGVWLFELIVVDNDGNESAPQQLAVQVRPRIMPPPPRGGGDTGGGGRPRIPDIVVGPRPTDRIDPRVIIRRPL